MDDGASIGAGRLEWRTAEGLTDYAEALTVMQERVAAIRAETAQELS